MMKVVDVVKELGMATDLVDQMSVAICHIHPDPKPWPGARAILAVHLRKPCDPSDLLSIQLPDRLHFTLNPCIIASYRSRAHIEATERSRP
jgi:hypothetical protein